MCLALHQNRQIDGCRLAMFDFLNSFLFLQRLQKLQRERLLNEFTVALNSFQSLQKEAAQREKDEVVCTF